MDRISLSVSVNCTRSTHIKREAVTIFPCVLDRLGTFLHHGDGWKSLFTNVVFHFSIFPVSHTAGAESRVGVNADFLSGRPEYL